MLKLLLRSIAVIMSLVVILGAEGCAKKVVIPEFSTAKEQYVYAMKLKMNTLIGYTKKQRKEQLKLLETSFMEVIKDFPEDERYTPAAYVSLGDTYIEYREPRKAIDIFEEAIMRYPDQADVLLFSHYGLGFSYDMIGEYEEAKKEYKLCVDKFGDDPRPEFQETLQKCRTRYERLRVRE